jgi:adenylyltransferase/sulfurtransferase
MGRKNERSSLFRYNRQMLFEELGEEGQRKLLDSAVVVAGCGGLGANIANTLVRLGIGHIKIVDRDKVELDNLHRQILYDEADVKQGQPKTKIAAKKLGQINSQVVIEPIVAHMDAANIEDIIRGADLLLDATDNFGTRMLLNDACFKLGITWIYAGVMAAYGNVFTIIPGQTACLRCFINDLPPDKDIPGSETFGVLPTAVNIIANIEVTEAIKLLIGKKKALLQKLINVDVWNGTWHMFEIEKQDNCPCCGLKRFDFLDNPPQKFQS